MKNRIPQYTFYKTKYGSELLIDVVELKYVKRFLKQKTAHTLTYYDITFVTEGEGLFYINNRDYEVAPRDVLFSRAGEVRDWEVERIVNGYALIFEDRFMSSVFKDPLFIQHLSFFDWRKPSSCLHLSDELYRHILLLLENIKLEIGSYRQNGIHVLRAFLYETLMLLNRAFRNAEPALMMDCKGNNHIGKFIQLVNDNLKKEHSVRFYADKLCISPNYLNEMTNSAMCISAKQYILDKIMEEAKRLLTYTNLSMSEIAFELNFSTVSYFIRLFRKCTGSTPLIYRRTSAI